MPSDRRPEVYAVMGGDDAHEWFLYPENPALLVGTQDVLLSRTRGHIEAYNGEEGFGGSVNFPFATRKSLHCEFND